MDLWYVIVVNQYAYSRLRHALLFDKKFDKWITKRKIDCNLQKYVPYLIHAVDLNNMCKGHEFIFLVFFS